MEIEVFVQGEGLVDTIIVRVDDAGAVHDLVTAAHRKGLDSCSKSAVFLEDSDEPIRACARLEEVGIGHRERIHIHRCKKVKVTVNFNGRQIDRKFPPGATVKRLKRWATGPKGFELTKLDASEHALQICGSPDRPDEDQHVGCLTARSGCSVCFDLVPKQRVEG
tara:strand:+ start:8529 stop:9023 length:495 start_codon:yes stop_codon:yes gene_type:complete